MGGSHIIQLSDCMPTFYNQYPQASNTDIAIKYLSISKHNPVGCEEALRAPSTLPLYRLKPSPGDTPLVTEGQL